jgi:hypothetical protein
MRPRILRAALLIALVITGCSSSHHAARSTPTTVGQSARSLQHLQHDLPAGFVTPGNATFAGGPANLVVAPAAGLRASDVHLAPFPAQSALRTALATVINQPQPLEVRKLFASTDQLRPSAIVTVVAAHLPHSKHHAALFILDGPNYRGEHLVTVGPLGVAAGIITLPDHLAPGTWYIAVQDLSELHLDRASHLTGTVHVRIGSFRAG